MPTSPPGIRRSKRFGFAETLPQGGFIPPEDVKERGPREIENFVGLGIRSLELVLPSEKGKDKW